MRRLLWLLILGGVSVLCFGGYGSPQIASARVALPASQRGESQTESIPRVGAEQKNVVILLDASGTMNTQMSEESSATRMHAAKAALKQVLKDVPADTQIGLLVLGAKNVGSRFIAGTSVGWGYRLGPRDDAELARAIDRPVPEYKTPLGACIRMASDSLVRQRTRQGGGGTYRLLIVTDGEADDPDLVDKVVPEAISNGITIDVIGVAMKETHTLATRVHKYYRADDLTALSKAVAQVFAEVSGSATDPTGQEVFDAIAPIPGEVVEAMIKALVSSSEP